MGSDMTEKFEISPRLTSEKNDHPIEGATEDVREYLEFLNKPRTYGRDLCNVDSKENSVTVLVDIDASKSSLPVRLHLSPMDTSRSVSFMLVAVEIAFEAVIWFCVSRLASLREISSSFLKVCSIRSRRCPTAVCASSMEVLVFTFVSRCKVPRQ